MSVFTLRSQTACVGPRITVHSTQSSTSSELAHAAAKPVHQLSSYCPSGKPFLIGPVSTEPRVNSPVFVELGYSTAKAVTPTSVRSLHTSVANSLRWAPHYGAHYTFVCVFRVGTNSGKASAPTSILLSAIFKLF